MVIFKYEIKTVNEWFKLEMPKGATPLAFQMQPCYPLFNSGGNGSLCLWVSFDEFEKEKEQYDFIALGTGLVMGMDKAEYIGTTQDEGFVFHLFWRPR